MYDLEKMNKQNNFKIPNILGIDFAIFLHPKIEC